MKKVVVTTLIGLGLMLGTTSTLSAGCGGCPKIHFPTCKKAKKVKKAKRSCGLHLPKCFHFSCKRK